MTNPWNMFIPEYHNGESRIISIQAIVDQINVKIKEVSKKKN